MPKFAQGNYSVINRQKFVGKTDPFFRSSWELAFMRMCDNHPNITKWASENVMIQYTDKNGNEHVELIEIKPRNQTTLESARTQGLAIQTAINTAKWTAAQEWCKRKGIRFKVINEDQIFKNNKPRKQKRISRRK